MSSQSLPSQGCFGAIHGHGARALHRWYPLRSSKAAAKFAVKKLQALWRGRTARRGWAAAVARHRELTGRVALAIRNVRVATPVCECVVHACTTAERDVPLRYCS